MYFLLSIGCGVLVHIFLQGPEAFIPLDMKGSKRNQPFLLSIFTIVYLLHWSGRAPVHICIKIYTY